MPAPQDVKIRSKTDQSTFFSRSAAKSGAEIFDMAKIRRLGMDSFRERIKARNSMFGCSESRTAAQARCTSAASWPCSRATLRKHSSSESLPHSYCPHVREERMSKMVRGGMDVRVSLHQVNRTSPMSKMMVEHWGEIGSIMRWESKRIESLRTSLYALGAQSLTANIPYVLLCRR